MLDATRARRSARPRVPQGIPKALTEAEVDALLGAVPGDDPRALRDRAILETLYAGGLRISELVGLDRGDLDSTTASSGCSARAARSGSCRSAAPRAPRSTTTSPRGRPELERRDSATGKRAATRCS